jgi:hypothetical protein
MNTRLKIICILFGVVYFSIIGEQIITGLYPGFIAGWNAGYNSTEIQEDIDFYAKPVKGFYSYPTPFFNTKTGQTIYAEFRQIHVLVTNPVKLPLWIDIAYIIVMFSSLFIFALLIYVPIQVYKVIRSIVKNELFEKQNISRLRKTGYCLLISFCYGIIANITYIAKARTWVSLEDYNMVFSMQEDYIYLLFGLIVLLFAEILKLSHQMKEEVDLTV